MVHIGVGLVVMESKSEDREVSGTKDPGGDRLVRASQGDGSDPGPCEGREGVGWTA